MPSMRATGTDDPSPVSDNSLTETDDGNCGKNLFNIVSHFKIYFEGTSAIIGSDF